MELEIPYGKRLKASEDKRMFLRFPGSEDVKTLPAGKPSPVIDSYTLQDGGFYQLINKAGERLYLRDTKDLKVVSANAKDDSSAFSSWYNWAADAVENTVKDVEKNAGFISEGFDKATNNFSSDFISFTKDIRALLLIGAGLLILVVIGIVTSKFS